MKKDNTRSSKRASAMKKKKKEEKQTPNPPGNDVEVDEEMGRAGTPANRQPRRNTNNREKQNNSSGTAGNNNLGPGAFAIAGIGAGGRTSGQEESPSHVDNDERRRSHHQEDRVIEATAATTVMRTDSKNEVAKASLVTEKDNFCTGKKLLCVLVVLLAGAAGSGAAVFVMTKKSGRGGDVNPASGGGTSSDETWSDGTPSDDRDAPPVPRTRFQILHDVASTYSTNSLPLEEADLNDVETTRGKALSWLAFSDEYTLDMVLNDTTVSPDSDSEVDDNNVNDLEVMLGQRYIMTVLMYSLNIDTFETKNVSVCEWNGLPKKEVDPVVLGPQVIEDDDGTPSTIFPPTDLRPDDNNIFFDIRQAPKVIVRCQQFSMLEENVQVVKGELDSPVDGDHVNGDDVSYPRVFELEILKLDCFTGASLPQEVAQLPHLTSLRITATRCSNGGGGMGDNGNDEQSILEAITATASSPLTSFFMTRGVSHSDPFTEFGFFLEDEVQPFPEEEGPGQGDEMRQSIPVEQLNVIEGEDLSFQAFVTVEEEGQEEEEEEQEGFPASSSLQGFIASQEQEESPVSSTLQGIVQEEEELPASPSLQGFIAIEEQEDIPASFTLQGIVDEEEEVEEEEVEELSGIKLEELIPIEDSQAPPSSSLELVEKVKPDPSDLLGTTTIPTSISNLKHLTMLELIGGYELPLLHGTIPTEVGLLRNLTLLDLSENALHGDIPTELGALTKLEQLNLGSNALSGPLPSELGLLTNLKMLRLNNNQLNGMIPSELGRLSSLTVLDVSWNSLTGTMPTQLRNMPTLTQFYFFGNRIRKW